jgi:carboxymethylenebutenolidase
MSDFPFLYSNLSFQTSTAIIILPEIYGLNSNIKDTVNQFASVFNLSCFALDYFFSITGTVNDIPYSQPQIGLNLMHQISGQDFILIFKESVDYINKNYSFIKNFIVCGFCFGGKLSYLAGCHPKVSKVISFYGAGANHPFFEDESTVEALAQYRNHDNDLKVLSFYGTLDNSISVSDREEVANRLNQANIDYTEKVYPAKHAFFNQERDNYDKTAAEAAWEELKGFVLKN